MLKNIIVLPDGAELSSGVGEQTAIQNVTFTEMVNKGTELTLGSACASMLEATIISPRGSLSISAGTEITLYKEDDAGSRTKIGLFTTEKPTRASANSYKVTAYDRVSWLDKDLTYWLADLNEWPYTLFAMAGMVCDACGLTLKNTEIPNGSHSVSRFSADGITGRDLMQWIGEACGRFVRATAEGEIELAWYSPATASIGITAQEGVYGYYQNSLTYEDYQVAEIEKVQLRQGENDVGVIWPNNQDAVNTYVVESNYLLTTESTADLLPVAQVLYAGMQGVSYTPCKVSIPANLEIRAGNIVSITDRNGKTISAYVMKKTASGQRDTLECTGSHRRDSVTRVNNRTFEALSGKVLNLQTTVEGIKAEAVQIKGSLESYRAALELANDQLKTYVESNFVLNTEQDMVIQQLTSMISQTSEKVELTFAESQKLIDGVGNDLAASMEELRTYIRSTASGVEIGKSDSPYSALLANDRLEFRDNGAVVAYISNNKMHITDLEVTRSARLTCFEFKQRSNGNGIMRYRRL